MKTANTLRNILMTFYLFIGCLGLSLLLNECKTLKLPLIYLSPEARLDAEAKVSSFNVLRDRGSEKEVNKKEMRGLSKNHLALILDARPKIFFELGHIPSALSLPREDFENYYQSLQKTLVPYRNKMIVVYCSDSGCPDSRLVAEILRKLGYLDVRLFRGGWDEWIDDDAHISHGCHCGD